MFKQHLKDNLEVQNFLGRFLNHSSLTTVIVIALISSCELAGIQIVAKYTGREKKVQINLRRNLLGIKK